MLKISSRPMIVALAAAAIGFPPAVHAGAVAQAEAIHVTLTPTCGCCGAWAEFAEAHGFAVEREITEDYLGMKQAGSVPEELWSCHTATIGGYTIEGHVSFAAIDRLLAERPKITGISVPGMPAGSPGMGDYPHASYDVIAFGGTAGTGAVFFRVGN
jgi:hypothetical protein